MTIDTTFKQLNERCRKGECAIWWAPLILSIVYSELGRQEKSQASMAEEFKGDSNLSPELLIHFNNFKNPSHLQRVLENIRKAGLPEKPQATVP